MNRRAPLATVTAGCLVVIAAVAGVLATVPAYAATTQHTFLTFCGWWDNTPPGGDISFPKIHSTARGKGTFADPITFATAMAELSPGTRVWVPRVRKYVIMEDSCQECGPDWSGHGANGGPGLRHIDLWLGGKGGSAFDAIDCGAQPTKTVGQYKNGSTGQCLTAPASGTALKTATCNSAASEQFTFHGAFLIINNKCAAMSGGNIVLATCTGGPTQQWSINPNGTISDIQTGHKCIRASGTNVVAGSRSGAASQWAFTPSGSPTNDFALSLNPASGSVTAGSSTTVTPRRWSPAPRSRWRCLPAALRRA